MKLDAEDTVPCPLCGTPLVMRDGKAPKHGRRMGVGIMPCDMAAPGVGFSRQWAKKASKEKKSK